MCVCIGVPLRNDFLRDKGALHAKSPTTRRYTQVLNQINPKLSQILINKNNLSIITKHSHNITRHQPNSYETQNKQKKERNAHVIKNQTTEEKKLK